MHGFPVVLRFVPATRDGFYGEFRMFVSCKIVHIFVEENYYLIVLFSFFLQFTGVSLNHRNGWFKHRAK